MLKKKLIVITGAAVITAALMAGITYAWFTDQRTSTSAVITAGKLEIAFELDNNDQLYDLYPQVTEYDENNIPKPVYEDPEEFPGVVPDVAERTYTLTNKSDRHILVRIDAAALLESGAVEGSELDGDYVKYVDGKYVSATLDNPDAVLFYYEVTEDDGVKQVRFEDDPNTYVYMPYDTSATVTLYVWIDGNSDNDRERYKGDPQNAYQNAVITFEGLTAKATQYRLAAIQSVFGLDDEGTDFIYSKTNVIFE